MHNFLACRLPQGELYFVFRTSLRCGILTKYELSRQVTVTRFMNRFTFCRPLPILSKYCCQLLAQKTVYVSSSKMFAPATLGYTYIYIHIVSQPVKYTTSLESQIFDPTWCKIVHNFSQNEFNSPWLSILVKYEKENSFRPKLLHTYFFNNRFENLCDKKPAFEALFLW